VDVSLFGAAMWAMQRTIAQSTFDGVDRFPRPRRDRPNNVLVNNYLTSDNRFISLGMLQADKFWPRFCEVAGRPELARDPRFVDARARAENVAECLAELRALFAGKTLAEWREILARQDGQWDVVQYVGEISADRQAQANRYVQSVEAGEQKIPLVSVPMQFDGAPLPVTRAPDLGRDSDALLAGLGYSEDAILELKAAGVVF
jgi:crotonobetainyl-CoA:carnitine CoA-transferase CaiB-like acyl-CoA transferase